MPNKNHVNWLLELMKELTATYEVNEVTGVLRRSLRETALDSEMQRRARHLVGGLFLVHVMALEEALAEEHSVEKRFSVWDRYTTPDEQTQLGALRHIRHSVAHGFNGSRARQNREAFEAFDIARERGLIPPRILDRVDGDSLWLADTAGMAAAQLLSGIAQNAASKAAAK